MFIFLPATSKQHQVATALLQWPQNCFPWLKRKGMHVGRKQRSLSASWCFRMGCANPRLKLKQKQKKCKKKPKPNNLKNTEQEGAQDNCFPHPWLPQKTAVSFASTVLTPPVLRALVWITCPPPLKAAAAKMDRRAPCRT